MCDGMCYCMMVLTVGLMSHRCGTSKSQRFFFMYVPFPGRPFVGKFIGVPLTPVGPHLNIIGCIDSVFFRFTGSVALQYCGVRSRCSLPSFVLPKLENSRVHKTILYSCLPSQYVRFIAFLFSIYCPGIVAKTLRSIFGGNDKLARGPKARFCFLLLSGTARRWQGWTRHAASST